MGYAKMYLGRIAYTLKSLGKSDSNELSSSSIYLSFGKMKQHTHKSFLHWIHSLSDTLSLNVIEDF